MKIVKPVELLQVSDFIAYRVWEYVNDDALGENVICPVEHIPVDRLDGRLVGVRVVLANREQIWASIENIDVSSPRRTEHFLLLSVEKGGRWFTLARYHDLNYAKNGPHALATFLGLTLENVFPISYDVSMYATGIHEALMGKITQEPRERLTRAELIAMAI